jgi:hypothetical protein
MSFGAYGLAVVGESEHLNCGLRLVEVEVEGEVTARIFIASWAYGLRCVR